MFKYKGVKFIKTVYRPYPPLMASLFFISFYNQNNWKRFIGFNYKLRDTIVIDNVYYYPSYHLENFARRVVKNLFLSKTYFLKLQQQTLKQEKTVSDGNKGKNWRKFFIDYLNYQPTLALYNVCDDFIEKEISRRLLEKCSSEETNSLMSRLNVPIDSNADKTMKTWLLKTGDLEGFIKRYSWNFSRFGQHRLYSLTNAKNLLNSIKREPGSLNRSKNLADAKKAIKQAKKILGDKAYYIDVMHFFIYYRTRRTDILNKVFFDYYGNLIKLAKSLGLSYKDLLHCSYEELISGNIPKKSVLEARKRDFVIYNRLGRVHILTGHDADNLKKLITSEASADSITGQSASPGLASGRVKVIKSVKDFYKLGKGDILVAAMTTPNMISIMNKAAAFVTDEGGITCHAAILSRELKKPCIIGTRIATEIFKDGDLVEVNADKGVVKLLKR